MKRSRLCFALLLAGSPPVYSAPDGDLDSTFRDDGKYVYEVPSAGGGRAVDVRPDGSLVIGYTAVLTGTDRDMRLLPLADDGLVLWCGSYNPDLGGTDEDVLFDIAAWGPLVYVAGGAAGPPGDPDRQTALAAINSETCARDTSFGGADGYLWATTAPTFARSVVGLPQGGVRYVAFRGPEGDRFASTHGLNTAGFVEGGFSQEVVNFASAGATEFEPAAMARQPDGKVLVVGALQFANGDRDVGVARFEIDGDPDPTWSGDGLVSFSYDPSDVTGADGGHAIAVLPDRRVVVVGSSRPGASKRAAVAVFNPTGTLHGAFGTGGRYVFEFPGGGTRYDELRAVAVQGDGKIVVAGTAATGSEVAFTDFGIARLLSSSASPLDPDFGVGGRTTIGFDVDGNENDHAYDLTLGQGGKISVVGSAAITGAYGVAAARLWNSYIFADGFEWGTPGSWSGVEP